MKTHLYYILLLFVCITQQAMAVTYTSLRAGSWSNATNVWSTNGTTACACTPGATVSGNSVIINHAVSLTTDVTVSSGGSIYISASGRLTGTARNLTINNNRIDAYGPLSVKEFTVNSSGSAYFYSSVEAQSKFIIYGSLTFDSLISVQNGSIELKNGSYSSAGMGCLVSLPNGNVYSAGTLHLSGTSICIPNGNFYNESTGSVTGFGYIDVLDGSISNSGSWDTDVDWCSDGSGSGMPEPHGCLPGICSGVLPVDLVQYEARADKEKAIAYFKWTTASEQNNDYFEIEKSADGRIFTPLHRIEGAGTTSAQNQYTAKDPYPYAGQNFYRLSQTDFNGDHKILGIRGLSFDGRDEIFVYPIPVRGSSFFMRVNDYDDRAHITLIGPSGNTIPVTTHNTSVDNTIEIRVNEKRLLSGLHCIIILMNGQSISKKIIFHN